MFTPYPASKYLLLGLLCGMAPGCEESHPSIPANNPPPPIVTPDRSTPLNDPSSPPGPVDPTNTEVNEPDRNATEKTPLDQGENTADIDITAEIRKQVVDSNMSVDAQNIKIITQDSKVTLRGPVATAEEKQRIGEIAEKVAGPDKVDNQLEITTP